MNICVKVIIAGCTIAALLPGAVPAQQDGKSAKSPIVTQDVNPRLKAPISMRAQDANLSEILRVLAERSGMNFVTGEGVHKEKITIILNKTPVDEAIDLVVRAAGLSYEIIGNSVLIAESDKLKGEVGQQGYVIDLKYVNAAEVAVMLGDLTKNVKVDRGGNKLICFTSPRVINEIERIVKSIDHPHILVMLEARLIEVSMDRLKQYGVNWSEMSPLQSGVVHPEVPLTKGYNVHNWGLKALNLDVSLDVLVQNGDAKLLMNSQLATTNNREAKLHIGEIIPYTVQSYNLSSSGGSNLQIEKENVGVLLSMTPHVNENRQVTLTLSPEVSNIIGWKGPNMDMPLVKVRKTTTTIRVEDGQTVFLAGLLSEENTSEVRKLPVLGDIPLIGLLFQHKRKSTRKTNLILEVKPTIIIDSSGYAAKESSEDQSPTVMLDKGMNEAPVVQQPAELEQAPAPAVAAPVTQQKQQTTAAPAAAAVKPAPVAQPRQTQTSVTLEAKQAPVTQPKPTAPPAENP